MSRLGRLIGTSVHGSAEERADRARRSETLLEEATKDLVDALRRYDFAKDDGDRVLKELDKADEEFHRKLEYYYEKARDEIDRENYLSIQRLTAILNFQWFSIGAAAAILVAIISSFDNFGCMAKVLVFVPPATLSALSAAICFFGFRGIEAARSSLRFAKDQWVAFNRINGDPYPSRFPQLTKRANEHSFDVVAKDGIRLSKEELLDGKFYQKAVERRNLRDDGYDLFLAVPSLMLVFWSLLLIACLVSITVFIADFGACSQISWFERLIR